MEVKILISEIGCKLQVAPGDTINLTMRGQLVHTKNITCCEVVSHYACVVAEGTQGYFIGDKKLPKVMKKLFPYAQIMEM
jgi:hypothetical protein